VTRDKSALGILLSWRLCYLCRLEVALLVSGAVIRGDCSAWAWLRYLS